MSSSSDGKAYNTDITADPSDFLAGMRRAAEAAAGAADQIKGQFGRVGEVFSALQRPLLAISAIMAGGAFFKDAISAANKLSSETLGLAKSLGVGGEQASALRTALDDIGSDTETYVGAFQKFAKQLKTNEEGLVSMGLQTRDANGHLRDSNTLFTEALQTVGAYKSGLNQTTAAMTLFGKGVDEVMTLQKLNTTVIDEAKTKNEELGMVITKEGVEGSKAYKRAINDVGDVFLAIKNVIAQAVMPVFTRLAEWFAEIGPAAVTVFKVAIGGVATALHGVIFVAQALWEVLRALVDPLFTFGRALKMLLAGDVTGATVEMQKMAQNWGKSLSDVFDKIKQDGIRTWNDVQQVWSKGTVLAAPTGGTRTMGEFKTPKQSQIPKLEAELQQRKAAIERQGLIEGQLREMSKAEEFKYWDEIKARRDLSDKDRAVASRKAADVEIARVRDTFDVQVAALQAEQAQYKNNTDERLRIEREIQAKFQAGTKQYEESEKRIAEIRRQAAEQDKAVAQSRVDAHRQAELQVIALEEQSAQTSVQLGVMTQQQLLDLQQGFEERRFVLSKQALEERLAMAEKDPDRNPVELEKIQREIEALEQQHQLRMGQIRNASLLESNKHVTGFVNDLTSGLQSVFARIGTQIKSIGDLTKAMWQTVAQVTMQMLAKIVAEWIKEHILMKVLGKTLSIGKIAEKSAEAGAGGVASMAAAPFPLNLSAPAFGAAMSAAALAFAPMASAAGGFDIPGTVNPIVQAHAREMILPAKHADVIRNMADNGVQASAPAMPELRTVPMGEFLAVHTGDFVKFLKSLQRNNAWKP